MFRNQVFDQILGRHAHGPKQIGALIPDQADQITLIHPLTHPQLPAIAPRCTKADALRVDHHTVVSQLRQMQRGGHAGIARANDAHIRRCLTLQGRKAGQRRCRCRIPAGRIFAPRVVGKQ